MALINARQLDTSAPQWLVGETVPRSGGMIPRTGYGVLYGRRSAGKSLLAMELALDVGNGVPFFGRPVVQGNVVLCLGEGVYDAGIRKQARIAAHDGPEPYTDDHMLIEPAPFTIPVQRNGYGDASYEFALAQLSRVPDLELVIVDPLPNFSGGLSVLSEGSANRYVNGLQRMVRELDCVVLVIAHALASGERMLANQRFENAADFVIQAVPEVPLPGEPQSGTLYSAKQKFGPAFDPVGYKILTREMEAPVLGDDGEPSGDSELIPVATVATYDPGAVLAAVADTPRKRKRTGLLRLVADREENTA